MTLPLHVLPCSPYDDKLKKSFIHQLSLHVDIHRELSPTVSLPIIVIFRPQGRPNDEFDGVVQPFFGKYKMCCNSNCRNIILFTAFATSQRYGRGFTPDCVSRFKYTDKLFISSGHLDTQVNKSTFERLGAILVNEYEFKVTDDQSQVDHSTGSDGNRYHSTGRDVDRHVDRDHSTGRDFNRHVDRDHSTGRDFNRHVDRDHSTGRNFNRHVDRDHSTGRDFNRHFDRDHSTGRDVNRHVDRHVDRDHSMGRDVNRHVDREHSPGRDFNRYIDGDHSAIKDLNRHIDRDHSTGRDVDCHVDRDHSPGRDVDRYIDGDLSTGKDVDSHVDRDHSPGRDVDRHIDGDHSTGRDVDSHFDRDHPTGRNVISLVDGNQSIGTDFNRHVDRHVDRDHSTGRDFNRHVNRDHSTGRDVNRHVDRDHFTRRDFNRHIDRDLSTGKDVDRHVDRYHSTGRDNPRAHCVTGCDQNDDDIDRLRMIKDEMKTKTTDLQLRVETKLKLRAGILPRILDKVLIHLGQEREAAATSEIKERSPLLLRVDVASKIEKHLALDEGSVNEIITSLLKVKPDVSKGDITGKLRKGWNKFWGKSST